MTMGHHSTTSRVRRRVHMPRMYKHMPRRGRQGQPQMARKPYHICIYIYAHLSYA